MGEINPLAVVAAAIASFVFASLWYSPVMLLAPWQKAAGREPQATPVSFAVAFVATLVSAAGLSWLLGPSPELGAAALAGLGVGLLVVAASFAINYQFAGRDTMLLAIDGGFHAVRFALMGAVLALLA